MIDKATADIFVKAKEDQLAAEQDMWSDPQLIAIFDAMFGDGFVEEEVLESLERDKQRTAESKKALYAAIEKDEE